MNAHTIQILSLIVGLASLLVGGGVLWRAIGLAVQYGTLTAQVAEMRVIVQVIKTNDLPHIESKIDGLRKEYGNMAQRLANIEGRLESAGA